MQIPSIYTMLFYLQTSQPTGLVSYSDQPMRLGMTGFYIYFVLYAVGAIFWQARGAALPVEAGHGTRLSPTVSNRRYARCLWHAHLGFLCMSARLHLALPPQSKYQGKQGVVSLQRCKLHLLAGVPGLSCACRGASLDGS